MELIQPNQVEQTEQKISKKIQNLRTRTQRTHDKYLLACIKLRDAIDYEKSKAEKRIAKVQARKRTVIAKAEQSTHERIGKIEAALVVYRKPEFAQPIADLKDKERVDLGLPPIFAEMLKKNAS